MGKKVKMANPGEVLKIAGYSDIHDGNLTFETYTFLVEKNPNLKVHFVEYEEGAKEVKSSKQKD